MITDDEKEKYARVGELLDAFITVAKGDIGLSGRALALFLTGASAGSAVAAGLTWEEFSEAMRTSWDASLSALQSRRGGLS